ncbi:MAG TPA: metallophosphoesterase [Candidatus Obscuribacterales bacterium]
MSDGDRKMFDRRKFMLGMAGLSLLSWNSKDAEAAAVLPFNPFTFAFVTDVHLANDVEDSYELVHESQLFLQELVKELNAERPDFVMFGGDQVQTIGKNEANWNTFLDCLQPLNAPWSFVLGDRDVSGPIPVDKFKTYGRDWKLVGVQGENAYWSQNPKIVPDIHVVGLDTSLPNTTLGGMSRRQLDWLKQDLDAHKNQFTIVFCHHPLLPPPPYDGGPPWDEYVIPDGGAVREILGVNPQVKLVISGHVHVSKVQLEREIWHISNPSLAVYPCSYRLFHVTPDMVTMETRQIDFPALVKKAKKELSDSPLSERFNSADRNAFVALVEGDREDRDALIPLKPGQPLKAFNPKKQKHVEEKQPEQTTNSENPDKDQAAQPEETHKRGLFRRREGTTAGAGEKAESAGKRKSAGKGKTETAGQESAGDNEPSKPVELEPVKNVDEELNKQLQMDDKKGSDGEKDK